jgi:erythronate-4-phosphate dehydrogenase
MKVLNILADENIPGVEAAFGQLGRVSRVPGRGLDNAHMSGVDVLLVRSVTRVDEALLDGHTPCFVGTATSGTDHVDIGYLKARGIGFSHAPGANANSVVEYVLAAIAASGDQLERLLAGGTAGIVGYGHIGRAMVGCLEALGIGCKVHDPWLDRSRLQNPASLEEVLACQVISLHAELTREQPWPSFHLLSEPELACIEHNSLLINASRGPVVDNLALLQRLRGGPGPSVVLDVWEGEPVIDPELLDVVSLATPHIAGYSLDGKILATRMLSAALRRQLQHPVQPGEGSPPPPELTVPAGLSGAALLRYLIEARYPIERDDLALRDAIATDPGDGRAFDGLRRDYPQRRELRGSVVTGLRPGLAEGALLAALGCRYHKSGDAAV